MKERIYVIVDLDETDPIEAIVAVMNNHGQAERTVHQMPTRNLVVTERDIFGSFDELIDEVEL